MSIIEACLWSIVLCLLLIHLHFPTDMLVPPISKEQKTILSSSYPQDQQGPRIELITLISLDGPLYHLSSSPPNLCQIYNLAQINCRREQRNLYNHSSQTFELQHRGRGIPYRINWSLQIMEDCANKGFLCGIVLIMYGTRSWRRLLAEMDRESIK